jgi:phage portal protein BeeE
MEDFDNPLAHMLQIAPNDETSAYSFFETYVTHLLLRGNSYAEIQRTAGVTLLRCGTLTRDRLSQCVLV